METVLHFFNSLFKWIRALSSYLIPAHNSLSHGHSELHNHNAVTKLIFRKIQKFCQVLSSLRAPFSGHIVPIPVMWSRQANKQQQEVKVCRQHSDIHFAFWNGKAYIAALINQLITSLLWNDCMFNLMVWLSQSLLLTSLKVMNMITLSKRTSLLKNTYSQKTGNIWM